MPIKHKFPASDVDPNPNLVDAPAWNDVHNLTYNVTYNPMLPSTTSAVTSPPLYAISDVYIVQIEYQETSIMCDQVFICQNVFVDGDIYRYVWAEVNTICGLPTSNLTSLTKYSGVLVAGNNVTFSSESTNANPFLRIDTKFPTFYFRNGTPPANNQTDLTNYNVGDFWIDQSVTQVYSPCYILLRESDSTTTPIVTTYTWCYINSSTTASGSINASLAPDGSNPILFSVVVPQTSGQFSASGSKLVINNLPSINATVGTTTSVYNTLTAGNNVTFTGTGSSLAISSSASPTIARGYYYANNAPISIASGANSYFGYSYIDGSGTAESNLPWIRSINANGILGSSGSAVFVLALNATNNSVFFNPSQTKDITLLITGTVGWSTTVAGLTGSRYVYVSRVQGSFSGTVSATSNITFALLPTNARRGQSSVNAGSYSNTIVTNNFHTTVILPKASIGITPSYIYYGFFVGVWQNSGQSLNFADAGGIDYPVGANTELNIMQIG